MEYEWGWGLGWGGGWIGERDGSGEGVGRDGEDRGSVLGEGVGREWGGVGWGRRRREC